MVSDDRLSNRQRWQSLLMAEGEMSSSARLVGFVVSTYLHPDMRGECYASQETLGLKSKLSVRSVSRCLNELIDAGLLARNWTGGRAAATFTVHPKAADLAGFTDRKPAKSRAESLPNLPTSSSSPSENYLSASGDPDGSAPLATAGVDGCGAVNGWRVDVDTGDVIERCPCATCSPATRTRRAA